MMSCNSQGSNPRPFTRLSPFSYLLDHFVEVDDEPCEDLCLSEVFLDKGFVLAQDPDGQAGPGERVAVDQLGGQTQLTPEVADLEKNKQFKCTY